MSFAVTKKSYAGGDEIPYVIREVKKITKTRVYLEKPEGTVRGWHPEWVERRRVIGIFDDREEAEATMNRAHNKVVGMINTLNRDILDLQEKRTELIDQRRNEIRDAASEILD